MLSEVIAGNKRSSKTISVYEEFDNGKKTEVHQTLQPIIKCISSSIAKNYQKQNAEKVHEYEINCLREAYAPGSVRSFRDKEQGIAANKETFRTKNLDRADPKSEQHTGNIDLAYLFQRQLATKTVRFTETSDGLLKTID